ncbi:hypothetical protein CASFOL_003589 [Castilleja foliolosa]|uniref:Uncharacterized protein n=1 Tax=Castilleja foliolosa TaxID=1961234 RepID=A0ABD3EHL7_9LAMI
MENMDTPLPALAMIMTDPSTTPGILKSHLINIPPGTGLRLSEALAHVPGGAV